MAYSSGNKVSPSGVSWDPGAEGTPTGSPIRAGVSRSASSRQAWGGSDHDAAKDDDDFDGGRKVSKSASCCTKCVIWTSVSLLLLALVGAGAASWYVACVMMKACSASGSTCECIISSPLLGWVPVWLARQQGPDGGFFRVRGGR